MQYGSFLETNILLTSISSVLNIFLFFCKSQFFRFFCHRNLCSFHSFLYSKEMGKNGYCGNDGFIFAWDLVVIFLGILNFKILRFRIFFFFKLGLKGVIEKCVGCFLVYLFLGVFFRLKSVKKMCLCDKFKKGNVTYEKCIY